MARHASPSKTMVLEITGWHFSLAGKEGMYPNIWVCPKIAIPENGWFIVENPIKMDDLGVPLFLEIPISQLLYAYLKVPKMERIAVISY